MPSDSDYDEQMRERLYGDYPPLLFLRYDVPDHVPRLGAYEELEHLQTLYDKNEDFVYLLDYDSTLFERLKQGLKVKKPPGATGTPATSRPTSSEAEVTIEAALINRAEFAEHQLARLMVCEPHMYADKKERQRLLHAAYDELVETLELLQAWGSKGALDEFEEKMDIVDDAIRFGKWLDVVLAVEEPSAEDSDEEPVPVCRDDVALPTTLEERSSGEGETAPMSVAESQGTWVTLPSPEKGNQTKKPKF